MGRSFHTPPGWLTLALRICGKGIWTVETVWPSGDYTLCIPSRHKDGTFRPSKKKKKRPWEFDPTYWVNTCFCAYAEPPSAKLTRGGRRHTGLRHTNTRDRSPSATVFTTDSCPAERFSLAIDNAPLPYWRSGGGHDACSFEHPFQGWSSHTTLNEAR